MGVASAIVNAYPVLELYGRWRLRVRPRPFLAAIGGENDAPLDPWHDKSSLSLFDSKRTCRQLGAPQHPHASQRAFESGDQDFGLLIGRSPAALAQPGTHLGQAGQMTGPIVALCHEIGGVRGDERF